MTRCLIVANRTMGGRKLSDHLLRVAAERGPAQFHLVVPEHGLETLDLAWAAGGFGVAFGFGTVVDDARAESHQRLQRVIAKLRELGLDVTGEIGPAPPVAAIAKALDDQTYDEIVLSTLPVGFSKWLRMDLPRRISRKFDLPVTTVVHDDDEELVDPQRDSALAAEERVVRAEARRRPLDVLVVGSTSASSSRLCAALGSLGLCTPEVVVAPADVASRLATGAPPDVVAVSVDAGGDTAVLGQVGAIVHDSGRALLVVADHDDSALRRAADAAHAWAFVPLTDDPRADADLLDLMLVELVAIEHRNDAADAPSSS